MGERLKYVFTQLSSLFGICQVFIHHSLADSSGLKTRDAEISNLIPKLLK